MEAVRRGSIYPYGLKAEKRVQRAILTREKRMTEEERKLTSEIEEAYLEMATTLNHLNQTTDPELIEYYAYKYKADQLKYGYLIRCMKKIWS